jgi:dipeptidyl aminopeptidase/acylaminoacyl peptidase
MNFFNLLNHKTLIAVFAFFLLTGFKQNDGLPRPVGWQDVAGWKYIPGGSATLSSNGEWFAYWYSPGKGNSELVLQSTVDDTRKSFDIGQVPGGSGSPDAIAFSNDSRFVAFMVYPEKEDKSGPGQGNGASAGLTLYNLAGGDENTFENVRNFSFSGQNPEWLAIHLTTPKPSEDKDAGKGTDLLLVELSTGNRLTFGNVSDYGFDKKGRWLAWLTDTWGKAGNGLQLREMETGRVISPDNDKAEYRYLSWTKNGDGLAVLRGTKDETRDNKVYTVIGLKGFDKPYPARTVYTPCDDPEFPAGMSISPNRRPEWSDNLITLFFGIHENKTKAPGQVSPDETADDDTAGSDTTGTAEKPAVSLEKPDLVLWHWQDSRLQSVQRSRESSDKNFTYLSLFNTKDRKFIRLADEDVRTVNAAPRQKYALGLSNSRYELSGGLSGENFADVYIIDLSTGERTPALERHRMMGGLSASPDGEHFVYFSEGNYYSLNFATAIATPLTENIPSSFVDEENDRNVPFPPTPLLGWTNDSKAILVRDNWNIWKIARDGRKSENLTGDGKRNGKRYQFRFPLDPDEEGIDLGQPLFIRVFDEGTKQSGISRIDSGRKGIRAILHDDALFGNLQKARDNDTYVFTRETVTSPPDYFVSKNRDLGDPVQLSGICPGQDDFMLSPGSKLITYVSDLGDTLQAALYLPAGYQEGRQYPTVVYIYERLTRGLNSYSRPSLPGGGFNRAMYNSNGYAVLMPDIVYKLNDPGMSAVWCVLPAVEAALETGIIDAGNIAIHGHSWGGYQTSFLITQTDMFRAAVAGAPLTNMISMYSLIYWNTGSTNQPIFESSQGRLTPGYWDNMEAFQRNSPVYYAKNVNTPLLLMHNDKDGAVDFTQGIEYYNTLRRLEKPVIMLQYEGENHGLAKPANQIDYAVRMMEFLDHHLKGTEAPAWIREGVPRLEMEKHLDQRLRVLDAQ